MADTANLKERIHRGELIFGVGAQLYFSRSQLEDLLAQGDYSFVYVDSQHAGLCEIDLVAFCGHAESLGIPVQLRIPHTAPHLSDRPLSRPGTVRHHGAGGGGRG